MTERMIIKPLELQDCDALLAFEIENREWFEQFIPARPADYFHELGLRKIVSKLLEEQESGSCYMNLIFLNGKLVGRINLTSVSNGSAVLGYRLAKGATGQGVATKAVRSILQTAKDNWQLSRIEACTTDANIPSQRVLERAGFKKTHVKEKAAELHGRQLDLHFFERVL